VKWRVYFNRSAEAPQVWSVDQGSINSEINVRGFDIGYGCTAHEGYDSKVVKGDTRHPRAWIVVTADVMTIDCHGNALFIRTK
jgi:hypothetical protein